MKKLLNKIEYMPYNTVVGILYKSGNIKRDFWYDIGFKKWIENMTTLDGDKPIYWFNLSDLKKAFLK